MTNTEKDWDHNPICKDVSVDSSWLKKKKFDDRLLTKPNLATWKFVYVLYMTAF